MNIFFLLLFVGSGPRPRMGIVDAMNAIFAMQRRLMCNAIFCANLNVVNGHSNVSGQFNLAVDGTSVGRRNSWNAIDHFVHLCVLCLD